METIAKIFFLDTNNLEEDAIIEKEEEISEQLDDLSLGKILRMSGMLKIDISG